LEIDLKLLDIGNEMTWKGKGPAVKFWLSH
jgi:hypothetical protein